MGTCCSTHKHAVGEGATSHDHESTIDNPIHEELETRAVLAQFDGSLDLDLETHKTAKVLEAFDASLSKGVAQVEEQKMAAVLAQFDRSLDVGLAKHAAAAEEAAPHAPAPVSVRGNVHVPSR